MGNASTLSLGPGLLYHAPVGTEAPDTLAEALNVAWAPVGYTNEGSEFSYEISTEAVEVAEELDPLFYRTTGRNGTVTFAMAENTVQSLTLAFNGGTVTSGTGGEVTYTPPEPGDEERRALLFVSEDGEEIWHYPKVFQGGSVSMARRKGSEKTSIPVEFRLEKISGQPPFKVLFHGNRD